MDRQYRFSCKLAALVEKFNDVSDELMIRTLANMLGQIAFYAAQSGMPKELFLDMVIKEIINGGKLKQLAEGPPATATKQ